MRRIFLYVFLLWSVACGAQKSDHYLDVAKNLDVFNVIYKHLEMMYVDSLNPNEVIGTGIKAMLRSLDPYTEYYPEDKKRELEEMWTGKFAGIGALIRYNPKLRYVVIEEPYKGMPAAEAGLRKGDIILAVGDSSMAGKDTRYVSSRLRGEAGTSFMLKIKRPSTGKQMRMKITRAVIKEPAVPYYGMLSDSIGYITLRQYTDGCSKEVRRAMVDLKQRGMRKLIFDLRNNGGGAEMEAVDIVNLFVRKGQTIVSNRGRLERSNHDYKTRVEPLDSVMPVVVLVNGSTASASEITAGALQDLDRAVILGTRTYGKGLVQASMDMPYNGSLKLTTYKYYIPSGRCIQAVNYRRDGSGSAEQVADSLTRVFHTAGGREVRDGGGIMPDMEVRADSLPNIAYYLEYADSNCVMLNYEAEYIAAHPTIAPPQEFELADSDYEMFKKQVLESGFSYDFESEKLLKNLIKLAKFEGYYEESKAEFDILEKKLKHNIEHDLEYHKPLLKQLLANGIVSAYYYQAGAIQNSLRYDKQVKAAIDLLRDAGKYQALLLPVK